MSCKPCNQVVVPEELPPLELPAVPETPACEPSASAGCTLDACLTDPRDLQCDEGMVLLGRVGQILARFKGNGWIEIRNNLAYLVATPALRIKNIWAKWDSRGKAGDPLPFPYSVAVGPDGIIHALGGLLDTDSLQVHNATTGLWEVISVAKLKKDFYGTLPQSDGIELTGYEDIGVLDGACEKERPLKALRGAGMVYLEKVVIAECADPCVETAFAYVAKVLVEPDVTAGQVYSLKFSNAGLAWVLD